MGTGEVLGWIAGPVFGSAGTAIYLRRMWNRDTAEHVLISKIMEERNTAVEREKRMAMRYEELQKIHLQDSIRLTEMIANYEAIRQTLRRVRREGAKLDPSNSDFQQDL